MRIRMLRDLPVSSDGINVITLKAGESYDLPKSQAKRYLGKELAERDKAVDKAPENKSLGAAPENKAEKKKKGKGWLRKK